MPRPEAPAATASPQAATIPAVSQIELSQPSSVQFSSETIVTVIHFLTYLASLLYITIGGAVTSDETTSQRSAVQKSDFRILRTIGRGTYGKVYLVQHLQTEQIFAMKSVQKEMLIRTDQVAGIRGKQELLSHFFKAKPPHPF